MLLVTAKPKLQTHLKFYVIIIFWFVDGTSTSPSGTMACSKLFVLFFSLLCNQTVAVRAGSSVSCYKIDPGMLACIISADVLLTVILVSIVYRCARIRHRKNHKPRKDNDDHKVYMNVPTSSKS
ncbi:hematopoietic cell signal transducer [Festucalex cinctus]